MLLLWSMLPCLRTKAKVITLQWMAPHLGVSEQHKLDSVGYEKKKKGGGTQSWGGWGGGVDLQGVRE